MVVTRSLVAQPDTPPSCKRWCSFSTSRAPSARNRCAAGRARSCDAADWIATRGQMLDGKCIYANCCMLRIVFSTLNDITAKRQDERTRDFTLPAPAPADVLLQQSPHAAYQVATLLLAPPATDRCASSIDRSLRRRVDSLRPMAALCLVVTARSVLRCCRSSICVFCNRLVLACPACSIKRQ